MNVLIVDDEIATVDTHKAYLTEFFPQIRIVGQANSVANAVEKIRVLRPDLVLLDIELGDGSGFDVLKAFQPPAFKVIFVTAFDQYAVQAFRYSAIDYILKPANPFDFQEAISKVIGLGPEQNNQLEIRTLLHNLSVSPKAEKRIILRTSDDIHLINSSELVRVESDGAYSHFMIDSGKRITVSQNIKHYEDLLTPLGFFRCHQSHLVNVLYISRFHKNDGGMLVLKDGTSIPVSFRKKDSLLKLFDNHGIK